MGRVRAVVFLYVCVNATVVVRSSVNGRWLVREESVCLR